MNPGPEPESTVPGMDRALEALAAGALRMRGRMVWSSNATFLVEAREGELRIPAVYKPRRGEAPLWDFPPGTLCQREMAAFVLSRALGWQLVPPTVLRDGPLGYGVIQLFVEHDPDLHFLALPDPDIRVVRKIVAFDVAANNGDRKSGHILQAADGALWAIDHGLCFHTEPKLRTVIWELAGQPLPLALAADLGMVAGKLADPSSDVARTFAELLDGHEVEALRDRMESLVRAGVYPSPDPHRRSVPWPPV